MATGSNCQRCVEINAANDLLDAEPCETHGAGSDDCAACNALNPRVGHSVPRVYCDVHKPRIS